MSKKPPLTTVKFLLTGYRSLEPLQARSSRIHDHPPEKIPQAKELGLIEQDDVQICERRQAARWRAELLLVLLKPKFTLKPNTASIVFGMFCANSDCLQLAL